MNDVTDSYEYLVGHQELGSNPERVEVSRVIFRVIFFQVLHYLFLLLLLHHPGVSLQVSPDGSPQFRLLDVPLAAVYTPCLGTDDVDVEVLLASPQSYPPIPPGLSVA